MLLDEAYGAGIRYVDVARSYGRAEEFAARWLGARGRTDVEVGSKWGYRYVGDWQLDAEVHEVKDHSVGALREQWPLSRHLLGDRLGRYLVHSATLDSGALT
ncbi:MAG TPA: aldo/keto reductase, partial [Actinotalea sp.]|nr:aldo/keto reductase [Actinotalea sp.]